MKTVTINKEEKINGKYISNHLGFRWCLGGGTKCLVGSGKCLVDGNANNFSFRFSGSKCLTGGLGGL
ncbi:hypothetical protein BCM20_004953 [Clostridium beijerinckii]|uniref:hypothetical protein n=1 Tax=Clostridium beijerinckii TaxID=1520 RepID=UPI000A1C7963|nr:hypothetical protein [Clostridium beijerinckii]NOW07279.1 hypothetical protein [Clostridium beijerinckii]NRT32700.1 hypothetical protein [Clostridium beijerinckii]NRT47872.1 hypothetical protein [Clostridium beijerinckii]NRZ23832.1 hypothetical protein [Clostridium beijerinckii]NYC04947.1 hypothetical protein [Clostridium beijerinckii]